MPKVKIIAYDIFQAGEERNTQSIKEALLREAVKQCECYATDILIFFEDVWKNLVSKNIDKAQLIFKRSGVDWIGNGEYDKEFINNTRIRSIATLTIIEADEDYRNMKLVIEHGNC